MGDLNYRIVEGVPDAEVYRMLEVDHLEALREKDQLNLQRLERKAFDTFHEGPLAFPPTYKYIPGTNKLDQRPGKKVRCPSWCDRVLWSAGTYGGDSLRRLSLDKYSSTGPPLSDHMPVNALFSMTLECSSLSIVEEPEDLQAEPLSPMPHNPAVEVESEEAEATAAAALATSEGRLFAELELEPPALVMPHTTVSRLGGGREERAMVLVRNRGGAEGEFRVCQHSGNGNGSNGGHPDWLVLKGCHRGVLQPGQMAVLEVVVDVEAASRAVDSIGAKVTDKTREGGEIKNHELSGLGLSGGRRACAVLQLALNGGGVGALLPIVYEFEPGVSEVAK
ncbi:unnamed protein product [Choristocarpus tenellus]